MQNSALPELVFNPNRAGYGGHERKRLNDFLSWDEGHLEDWTCKKTESGGNVYLFWFGDPVSQLAGVGISLGKAKPTRGPFDWTKATIEWTCDFKPLFLLRRPITLADIHSDRVLARWWKSKPYRGRRKIEQPAAGRLASLILERNPRSQRLAHKLGQFLASPKSRAARSGS